MIAKHQLVTLFLALATSLVFGQNFSKEFGKIGNKEIELKEYALDKDAEAVVLFDMAKSYFIRNNNSFDVVFERTTRIKILSEAGIKWAEVEIPIYQEGNIYEKVYDLEATAYNFENGKLNASKFDVSNVFEEKRNEYWNVKKFAIPNVKEGTIIEYRYKINSEYIFNFRDWEFQWKIPVVYSEYIAKMIPFYEYIYVLQGANKFDVYESYEDKGLPRNFGSAGAYRDHNLHDMVYRFGMEDVPAFGDEEFISSINDYIIKLDFQLAKIHNLDGTKREVMTTWEKFIKELLNDQYFGKYVTKSKKLSSKLLDVEKIAQQAEFDKFNAVMDYVKSNFNWNRRYDKYASKSPKNFVEDKFGNCADVNLFTIGLLNGVGIEAYPLILSTRNHGKIMYDYPFSHFFNYVVIAANVDGKIILTDATEIHNSNHRIPPRCINDKGLVIKKDEVEWIGLECLFPSSTSTFMKMEINEKDVLVDMIKLSTEYDALNFRNNGSERVKEKVKESYSVIDSTIVIENQLDKTKSYKLKYSLTAKPELVNDKIYVSPFLQETISDNPLKQKERKYPIDMIYPSKRMFNCTLSIPVGYMVDFVPEDLKIDNKLFELNYSIKTYDDRLQIVFYYYLKYPVYQPADYAKIKYYFNEIVKKGNEKIVFSKSLGGSISK